jgi:hypothetical protein
LACFINGSYFPGRVCRKRHRRKPNLKPYSALIGCGEAALLRGLSPFAARRSLTTIRSHDIPNYPAPV